LAGGGEGGGEGENTISTPTSILPPAYRQAGGRIMLGNFYDSRLSRINGR